MPKGRLESLGTGPRNCAFYKLLEVMWFQDLETDWLILFMLQDLPAWVPNMASVIQQVFTAQIPITCWAPWDTGKVPTFMELTFLNGRQTMCC